MRAVESLTNFMLVIKELTHLDSGANQLIMSITPASKLRVHFTHAFNSKVATMWVENNTDCKVVFRDQSHLKVYDVQPDVTDPALTAKQIFDYLDK
jgi:hypothetical protein